MIDKSLERINTKSISLRSEKKAIPVYFLTNISKIKKTEKIRLALKDLKDYGTLPFAGLARVGFIAVQLLKSMVEINLINAKEYNRFMSSCSTISKTLTKDKQKLNKKQFLKKYGLIEGEVTLPAPENGVKLIKTL